MGFRHNSLSRFELAEAFSFFFEKLLLYPDLSLLTNKHQHSSFKQSLSSFHSPNGFY